MPSNEDDFDAHLDPEDGRQFFADTAVSQQELSGNALREEQQDTDRPESMINQQSSWVPNHYYPSPVTGTNTWSGGSFQAPIAHQATIHSGYYPNPYAQTIVPDPLDMPTNPVSLTGMAGLSQSSQHPSITTGNSSNLTKKQVHPTSRSGSRPKVSKRAISGRSFKKDRTRSSTSIPSKIAPKAQHARGNTASDASQASGSGVRNLYSWNGDTASAVVPGTGQQIPLGTYELGQSSSHLNPSSVPRYSLTQAQMTLPQPRRSILSPLSSLPANSADDTRTNTNHNLMFASPTTLAPQLDDTRTTSSRSHGDSKRRPAFRSVVISDPGNVKTYLHSGRSDEPFPAPEEGMIVKEPEGFDITITPIYDHDSQLHPDLTSSGTAQPRLYRSISLEEGRKIEKMVREASTRAYESNYQAQADRHDL